MKRSAATWVLAGAAPLLLAGGLSQRYVNLRAPEPYMDEIFHVRQAQQYCLGNFHVWDPKITTPPGLYITSYLLSKLHSLLASTSWAAACSTESLRAHNLLFLLGTYVVLVILGSTLNPKMSVRGCVPQALALSMMPISYFFHGLYYTDPGSTFWVLLSYLMSVKGWHKSSALIGLVSVTYRQTNVIWIMFAAGAATLRLLSTTGAGRKTSFHDVSFSDLRGPGAFLNLVAKFVMAATTQIGPLVFCLWPYISVALTFVGFVYWNNGIVLGDRSNHIATLHIPQLYYFICTLFGFSIFTIEWTSALEDVGRKCRSARGCLSTVVLTAVYILSIACTVREFTIEHPFLLADNRHYSFYIWKNVYRRHPLARYAVVPGYVFAAWSCFRRFVSTPRQPALLLPLYAICTAVTLVPTPLFDFRYYIIPFLIYRVHTIPSSPASNRTHAGPHSKTGQAKASKKHTVNTATKQVTEFALACSVGELIFFLIVNVGTLYLFGEKGFTWPSEPGVIQRFMW